MYCKLIKRGDGIIKSEKNNTNVYEYIVSLVITNNTKFAIVLFKYNNVRRNDI